MSYHHHLNQSDQFRIVVIRHLMLFKTSKCFRVSFKQKFEDNLSSGSKRNFLSISGFCKCHLSSLRFDSESHQTDPRTHTNYLAAKIKWEFLYRLCCAMVSSSHLSVRLGFGEITALWLPPFKLTFLQLEP